MFVFGVCAHWNDLVKEESGSSLTSVELNFYFNDGTAASHKREGIPI